MASKSRYFYLANVMQSASGPAGAAAVFQWNQSAPRREKLIIEGNSQKETPPEIVYKAEMSQAVWRKMRTG